MKEPRITAASREELRDLSHAQKRIWVQDRLNPGIPLANIGGPVIVHGAVDLNLLEQALRLAVQGQDAFCLRFRESAGEIRQFLAGFHMPRLERVDFSECEAPEQELARWADQQMRTPLPLGPEAPAWRFALFHAGERFSGYLILCHHILVDGWSIQILTDAVCQMASRLATGEEIPPHGVASYFDHLTSEKSYLSSPRCLTDRHFWLESFAQLPPRGMLRNPAGSKVGVRFETSLEAELSRSARDLARRLGVSLNALFVTLVALHERWVLGPRGIVLGIPMLGRFHKKHRRTVGCFSAALPLGLELDPAADFAAVARHVHRSLRRVFKHWRYPYDLLVQDLELLAQGREGLFDVCVNYYNTRIENQLLGLPVTNREMYCGHQWYSLQLIVKDWAEDHSLTLTYDYRTACYSSAQITLMDRFLKHTLREVVRNPELPLLQLDQGRDAHFMDWLEAMMPTRYSSPRNSVIHRVFDRRAEATPDRCAVADRGKHATFAELRARAETVARALRARGVSRGSAIGILARHSIETVAAILGVLKSGACFVPLAPGSPRARLDNMLKQAGVSWVLSDLDQASLPTLNAPILDLTTDLAPGSDESPPPALVHPEDLAYVLFTSGSTGAPKGVAVEHGALLHYISWCEEHYLRLPEERFACYSSLAFDLTMTSIFAPLLGGHRVEIYADGGAEPVVSRIVREGRATVLKVTPAHLALLHESGHSPPGRLIVGGEQLTTRLARRVHDLFAGQVEILNEYGPTEATVGCMNQVYDRAAAQEVAVPIGSPIHNTRIHLLDSALRPVPLGAIAELFITGHGLARGYLGQAALTAQAFLPDPWGQGGRMYRTGDLARRFDLEPIHFLGRRDRQLKLAGYRIEPGEVESALEGHPEVEQAVATLEAGAGGPDAIPYLVLYYVARREIPEPELRALAARRLPGYMVPSSFLRLDALPLTVNGKVDVDRLPQIATELSKSCTTTEVQAEPPLPEWILPIFAEVLGQEHITPEDNFFSLGGDSVRAIQIAGRLSARGLQVEPRDLLARPRIGDLLAILSSPASPPRPQATVAGEIPSPPPVRRFATLALEHPNHYAQSVLLEMHHNPTEPILHRALLLLASHHDMLRARFEVESGRLWYGELKGSTVLKWHALTETSQADYHASVRELGSHLKASLDLAQGPTLGAAYFEHPDHPQYLLLTAHHLCVDVVSWRILCEDLDTLLLQAAEGSEESLPLKTDSYQEWATTLDHTEEKQPPLAESNQEESPSPLLWRRSLSCRGPRTFELDIAPEDVTHLCSTENPFRLTLEESLVLALALTMHHFGGDSSIRFELESHGRMDAPHSLSLTRTVGWFTALFPVLLTFPEGPLDEQVKALKEQLRAVPRGAPHQASGQGLRSPRFNFLGEIAHGVDGKSFRLASLDSGPDIHPDNDMDSPLEVIPFLSRGQLFVRFVYSQERLEKATLVEFAALYAKSLARLDQCFAARREAAPTPSDFDTVKLNQEELDNLLAGL